MATEPLGNPEIERAQAERDAMAERCARAEEQAAELRARLDEANARIAELEAAAPFSLFDRGDATADAGLARDGSDPRVLSLILAATSVVAAMVALLAFVNGNLFTTFGYAMVATSVGLAIAAAKTRVMPVQVSVTHGVVHAVKGETTYRFDVRNPGTRVDMVGQPGHPGWAVYFHRKGMDDFVVDASMVDAGEFVRQLREHRPEL